MTILKPSAVGGEVWRGFMTEQHIKLPKGSIEKTTTTLNLGPTHPATHGVFQNILELDGERIVSAEQTVGYIHRAFEKIAERRPLYQITPLTDRMNYCSSPIRRFYCTNGILHRFNMNIILYWSWHCLIYVFLRHLPDVRGFDT